ncbi:MAG: glycosyltransferase family 4 protein [Thermoleophilia bacterium]
MEGSSLRVVLVWPWYGESMGYTENCLPPALAELGAEVHVVTSCLQPFHDSPSYETDFLPLNGPRIQPQGSSMRDGFMVHRLPHWLVGKEVMLRGLRQTIDAIAPDVIQVGATSSFLTLQAAAYSFRRATPLFTSAHQTESASAILRRAHARSLRIPLRAAALVYRTGPGAVVGRLAAHCFAATTDCLELATRHYGVPRSKISVLPLGVDTKIFSPGNDDTERLAIRSALAVGVEDILCIYTGKFTEQKNPALLAVAIRELLSEGLPFRGLFVGAGPQTKTIEATRGCTVHPFVPWRLLPRYYRAADIGVWPREESMAMLDGAACGLPLVVSSRVRAIERHSGNGLTYEDNSLASLLECLRRLVPLTTRTALGTAGSTKMREAYSWTHNASTRMAAYREAACMPNDG